MAGLDKEAKKLEFESDNLETRTPVPFNKRPREELSPDSPVITFGVADMEKP